MVRRQGEGAGKTKVLGGKTEILQRQPPDRQLLGQALEHRIHQPVGKQSIGAQGQMGTVLLHRTKGPHHGAPPLDRSLFHLGPRHLGEAMLTRHDLQN